MQNSSNSLKGLRRQIVRDSSGAVTIDVYDPLTSFEKVLVSVPTPVIKGNFKDPNPWRYRVVMVSYPQGWDFQYGAGGPGGSSFRFEGCLNGSGGVPPSLSFANVVNTARNQAINRLNEKVRGSLDLATSLAETGQTLKMLNLVDRFKGGVSDMQRSYNREIAQKIRSFKSRRSIVGALKRWQKGIKSRYPGSYRPVPVTPGLASRSTSLGANGWCEYTYGWSPLINDIRGVAENVVGYVRNFDIVRTSSTQRLDATEGLDANFLPTGGVRPGTLTTSGKVTVKLGVKLRPNYDVGLAKWSSLNPLSVAWELVPYSFVVDWFLDIGSYMRNLESALFFDNLFVNGFESVFVHYERNWVVLPTKIVINGSERRVSSSTSSLVLTDFTRTVLTSYPAPHLPSFQTDLGASRLISAAALLRQLLK